MPFETEVDHRLTRRSMWVLAGIVAMGLGLRIYNIAGPCLWVDEFISLETSAGLGLTHLRLPEDVIFDPAPDLLALGPNSRWLSVPLLLARDDNHPPLYFLMLRGWRLAFGDSEAALRSLSVLLGMAAIIAFFDAIRFAYSTTAGLWGAAIMALATPQIQFSQEVRNYMLAGCFTIGLVAALMRVQRLGATPRRIAAIAVCGAGMALSHYYVIAPLLACVIYVAICLRGSALRGVIAGLSIAAVLFLAVWGWGAVLTFDV